MLFKLMILFTVVPLVELALLIQVGQVIGTPLTIALVAVTGAVGVLLAKSEGLAVLERLQDELTLGEVPGNAILDGLFILVGGAFLLTPGLVTDTLGFMFLIPFTRAPLKTLLRRKFSDMIARGNTDIYIRRW
jgi:UPF0716 protein FxsA